MGQRPALMAVGVGLLLLGGAAGITGYLRYRAAGHAIHAGRLPAPGRGPLAMSAGVVALAVTVVAIYALDHLG